MGFKEKVLYLHADFNDNVNDNH